MPIEIATHNGPFHADDVLAVTMIRFFFDPEATVVRTRDRAKIDAADVVVDVGDTFDPERKRFDHHQRSYQGPLSSAGMVLNWLEAEGSVEEGLASNLRGQLVDFVDAVDNGRAQKYDGVPTFSSVISDIGENAVDLSEFDHWFDRAAQVASDYLRGLVASYQKTQHARLKVAEAMKEAEEAGRAVLFFEKHLKWKRAYFENDGSHHPTDFVLFPGETDWRVVAIPPVHGSFDKKRPFPEEWAGLRDEELSEVVGVPGSRFCHKNLFLAAFASREAALEALEKWGLMRREA